MPEAHRVVVTGRHPRRRLGKTVAAFYGADTRVKVLSYGLKKEFLDGYNANDVLRDNRLTAEQITEDVKKAL